VAQLLVEDTEFGLLFNKSVPFLLQLLAVRGRTGSRNVIGQLANTGGDFPLKGDDVLDSDSGRGALVIPMEVDEALEGPLLAAGEQPVDWPLLYIDRWCL
jgi:hypothetical protein